MTDVVMPQMGESIVEGTLTKWLKKPGDRIERDEPLFEISTDKVDTEIPAPAAGVLAEIIVEEGKTVAINTVVARIDERGAAAVAPAAAQPEAAVPAPAPPPVAPVPSPAPVAEPAPAKAAEPAGPLSPLVRKMAREHNVDLTRITGTGAGGRITKQDVEQYLAARQAAPVPPPPRPPRRWRRFRPPPARPRRASNRSAPCASRSPSTWWLPSGFRRTSPLSTAWI